jgi:hypothetical protein
MERPRSRGRGTRRLADRVARGADAAALAAAIESEWREIETALAPIIGRLGVSALFRRSLHLTAPNHTALAGLRPNVHGGLDIRALTTALSQHDAMSAATAADALLQTFSELLATLIGRELAARLLDPVWSQLPSDLPVQDSTP